MWRISLISPLALESSGKSSPCKGQRLFSDRARLAATLGPRTKRISRRELVTVDLARTCELIAEPPEPMALRLSGCLLVGVARYVETSFSQLDSPCSLSLCSVLLINSCAGSIIKITKSSIR